ncbi:MAG: sulfurtransferase complex subunit TusB [Oceanospirillales bacterium]|uniref:tRNA 2-thiouridine synthesizing protein B n=1 Tax=Marinobacterium halophilum TaxID=267374 RepID=A0A2P8EKI2_9GAMM|nr:sulfurtransferase complex subunit TusB [Marinobacterium halophilum]MBR9828009.1 sulfurtransferase complex subunit TusB [Oceanospirillales bacterium]PSL09985.1 tRNA 2-thiouridine synthesizing protein B [Marinobacterium halophilum]
MTLHILNTPPSNRTAFMSCSEALSEQDTLLLIEEATYWLLPHHRPLLAKLPARVVALAPDRMARGIIADGFNEVDDAGFVELTIKHEPVVSWF